jgi:hypothetical protein
MSEYQYYEFAAIDEPLSDKQMRELRALSTRAEITPTGFVNEYQWGDFKGDPRKLIVGYFDAFLYYANWGTLWCIFRLPKEAVDVAAMKPFTNPNAIAIGVQGKRIIVDIRLEDEPGGYDVPYEQTLGPLIPARAALLEGDFGPLFVAWLAAVERRLVDDDAVEPCDVSQLPPMCAGTRSMASFLGISEDLLKFAYGPARKKLRVDEPAVLVKWVRELPAKEKDKYLERFIAEPANVVRSKLLKEYRDSQTADLPRGAQSKPRTAAALLASVKEH